MPDSIYYIKDGEKIPYDLLSDSLQKVVDSLMGNSQVVDVTATTPVSDPGYTPFIMFMSLVVVAAYIGVKKAWKEKGMVLLGSAQSRRYDAVNERSQALQDELRKNYHVYEGRDLKISGEQIEKILLKRSPYYSRLSPELKERFVKRTREFLEEKTFLIKSNEPFVEMPLLLSAAAVQLTLGLDKYELPHYQYIRIFPDAYFASGENLRILAGHVYGNTITVSWDHFLQGFETYNDGVNLGLHEMAHALYFQMVEANTGRCHKFSSAFQEVMTQGAAVLEQKNIKSSELLSNNAYRNLQEFWAETVELFFERPGELKRAHSALYAVMKDILQQDPANTLYPVA